MVLFASAQSLVLLLLSLVLFAVELWALIDAARTPATAFSVEGKRTKTFWLVLTGAGAAVGFLFVGGAGLSFLMFAAVLPAAVYLADVRPAVAAHRRRPPTRGRW